MALLAGRLGFLFICAKEYFSKWNFQLFGMKYIAVHSPYKQTHSTYPT